MSLTAFNRIRRMQQVESMKPENIVKAEKKSEEEIVIEQPIIEEIEEVEEKPTLSKRRARRV